MSCFDRTSSTMRLGRWLLLGALLLLGCADARATRVVGPDGADDWWKITCRDDHERCLEKATELCDGRYEVDRSRGRYDVGPVFSYYSGVMVIRCRTE